MKKLLIVDSNVNRVTSRTERLTDEVVKILTSKDGFDDIDRLILEEEDIVPLNSISVNKRAELIGKDRFDDPMFKYAHQFSKASVIILSAPYWDLSFPAMMKSYIESVCAVGVTYRYSSDGIPIGMCQAKEVIYVTTAGGYIRDRNFGYDMVVSLAKLFGIPSTRFISAEGLDIITNNPDLIMNEAVSKLDGILGTEPSSSRD